MTTKTHITIIPWNAPQNSYKMFKNYDMLKKHNKYKMFTNSYKICINNGAITGQLQQAEFVRVLMRSRFRGREGVRVLRFLK